MMDNNIKSYLRSSKIDYLSHFGQAWIGFNSWYDQMADDKSEWLRIKNASNASPMRDYFLQSLKSLNIVDPFIVDEVEKLSVCKCDGSTYKLDTSGFRFRLGCTNKNIFTEFLKNSTRLKVLKNRSYGLSFFKETNQEDKLFKQLYKQYSSHMATPEQIVHEYDASTITEELLSIDIDHYGEMLHHNLKKEIGKSIYTLDYVFGKSYFDLCERLNEITSIPTARKEELEEQYRCKGFDIFERYMYLLYSLRCAYFHGDLDPKNEIAQTSAQYALLGLRELINTIKQE